MRRKPGLWVVAVKLIAVALAFPAASMAQGKPGGPKNPPLPPGGPGLIAYRNLPTDQIPRSVMLMNPNGTGRRVVATPAASGYPSWVYPFDDGTLWLGWSAPGPGGDWGISVVNTHTGVPAAPVLVPTFEAPSHIAMSGIVPTDWKTESPDWSPPGPVEVVAGRTIQRVRVCFHMGGDDEQGEFRVWIAVVGLIYDLDERSFVLDELSVPLILSPASPDVAYFSPRFSPDGTRLAFNRQDFISGSWFDSIWVVDLDGPGIPTLLIDGPGALDDCPAWSPDGRYLAFRSDRSGRLEAWIADLVTSMVSPATPNRQASEATPTWSTDGAQIAYMDNSRTFVVSKIAGGVHYKLADGFWPDWSPVDLPPLP
jgi:WD40 repeat protein